jgi:phage terminase small subunit
VLEELGKIGFSKMLDYMRPGPDGDPTLEIRGFRRPHEISGLGLFAWR